MGEHRCNPRMRAHCRQIDTLDARMRMRRHAEGGVQGANRLRHVVGIAGLATDLQVRRFVAQRFACGAADG